MKKILITGVSRGLGKKILEHLTSEHYQIYGTVRNLGNYEDTEEIKFYFLDLENTESIDSSVERILQDADYIDVVVHNSGIAYLNPVDQLTDQERRSIFDVNFFGPIHLTEKILPFMRKRREGKIIFISSIVSVDYWPFLGTYGASKAALENVAFEWAVLLREWNISVSIVRPNPLPTDMKIMKSQNSEEGIYSTEFSNALEWERIEDVCKLIQEIIEDPNPRFDYQTGKLSNEVVNSILQQDAYQNSLKKYHSQYFPAGPNPNITKE